ncbi:MAG: L-serine ammonia-lyase, iron-sulfur-dependent, subunit alpha [Synergistaceae bacterium]|nr:L-serine ammonia-lyase, iron-sulfur-dependent, subunit alpha [Synergistaceae bacterium]
MRSIGEIVEQCRESGLSFAEQALKSEAEEFRISEENLRTAMMSRLRDMELSVVEAESGDYRGLIVPSEWRHVKEYGAEADSFSSPYVVAAARISMAVATYNSAMGRIVAAPTAGSCGILPGMLFAHREIFGTVDELLLDGLFAAAAVGEVTASRATLAGATGGCQAECGAAAAMGAAALVTIKGGSPEEGSEAVALTYKSVLGLVCDPVGGLVESPCIKRNAMLVSMGALGADLALAGVKSLIPADEVIDAMGQIGRALPETLRETGLGGVAVTPSGLAAAKKIGM